MGVIMKDIKNMENVENLKHLEEYKQVLEKNKNVLKVIYEDVVNLLF